MNAKRIRVLLLGLIVVLTICACAKEVPASTEATAPVFASQVTEETTKAVPTTTAETTTAAPETTTEEVTEPIETTEASTEAVVSETTTVPEETTNAPEETTVETPVEPDYSNVVFVGDSRTLSMGTTGPIGYGLIPDDSICAVWGGELVDASAFSAADEAGRKGRSIAVFWYGINDVQGNPNRDDTSVFIANYKNVIAAYRANNNWGTIVIVSLLNTGWNEKDHYDGQEENVCRYNEALFNLCAEEGYLYLDATSLLEGEAGLLEDNIHFAKWWYEALYIPFLIQNLGLS